MINKKKKTLGFVGAICLGIFGLTYYFFFAGAFGVNEKKYVLVDKDDNADSVFQKIENVGEPYQMIGVKLTAAILGYSDKVRTGRYSIEKGDGSLSLVRRLRNGMQSPVSLTIPSLRTLDRLAAELSDKLMLDSTELEFDNEEFCEKYGVDTATIYNLFIPNTYEIYWDISVDKFMKRMMKERDNFWNAERKAKAEKAGLSENDVMIIASIIDEETANNGEKPMVAGMYINRYKINMPLQADPTIKFAWKRFDIRRIYNNLLSIKSPYNTYRNVGLPPGPIRIPSVEGIEATLNYSHHDYLYMCAKEDFSGTHNFAKTYSEHLANAAKYTKALNERGIK